MKAWLAFHRLLKKISYSALLALVLGFGWGVVADHYKAFPYEQIQWLRNAVVATAAASGTKPRNTLFESFSPHEDIVMIGDSITEGALWNEIFPDTRIANRGIAGDKTADILGRLEQVIAVKPKAAFVMAGFNDLHEGVDLPVVLNNYAQIVERLRKKHVAVYIQSVVECSKRACAGTLARIREFNASLRTYAASQGIAFIDVNEGMTSEQEGLLAPFTYDGVHLLGKGYLAWSKAISPYIARN